MTTFIKVFIFENYLFYILNSSFAIGSKISILGGSHLGGSRAGIVTC